MKEPIFSKPFMIPKSVTDELFPHRQVVISKALAERAAKLLREEARVLFEDNTVAGKWQIMTPSDAAVKRIHDRLERCARDLQKARDR